MVYRSKFRRGGFRRRQRSTRWTGDQTTAVQTTAAGATGSFNMLVPGDYEVSSTLEEGGRGRLERIIGTLSLSSAGGNSEYSMAMFAIDEAAFGVGSNDPAAFASIRNGDVIWMRVGVSGNRTVDGKYETIEFDIKARRRLEDTGVFFAIHNVGATAIQWHLGFRMLLVGI